MSDRWRIRLAVLLASGFLVGAVPAGGDPSGARAVVDETIHRILAVLQDAALTPAQRRERIEEIAYQRFHFDTMSRLVLARRWKSFSPEQQQEFREAFREFLAKSYGRRLDRYEQESVEILATREEPRGDVTVHTRIVGGQADNVEIDYRMRLQDGTWGVIDVVVEGVSLVSSYRSQFQEVLGSGSPEDLLRRLHEKNAAPDPGEAAESPETS